MREDPIQKANEMSYRLAQYEIEDMQPLKSITHDAKANKLIDAKPGQYVRVEYESVMNDSIQSRFGLVTEKITDGIYFYGVIISRATEEGPEVVCEINAQDRIKNADGRLLGRVVSLEVHD